MYAFSDLQKAVPVEMRLRLVAGKEATAVRKLLDLTCSATVGANDTIRLYAVLIDGATKFVDYDFIKGE